MHSSSDEHTTSNKSNNSNNPISMTDEKVIRRRNRPDKKTRYAKEREEMISKLNKIIGIDEKNNSVFLYELENNPDLKVEIESMLDDIKKYYKYGNWGYFSNDTIKGHDNHIALIRAIYNDNDYDVVSKHKIATFDNVKKQYTQLLFYKK
jgi:hypothetical protein